MIKVKRRNLLFALIAIVLIFVIPLAIPTSKGIPLTEEFIQSSEGQEILDYQYPPPLQEFFSPLAAQGVGAACDPGCSETVCTKWIPGPSAKCPNPGPGGGCCTRYGTQCIPGCGDPPPPSYLPPQVLGDATCVTTGTNGWCIGPVPTLVITSSDPQGFARTITGSNPAFSCTNNCNVAIPVGSGTASFTAVAAGSGLSDSDTEVWKYDPTNPTLSLAVTGSVAPSGWYLIAPTVTATFADTVSGVASTQYRIDSGAWVAGPSVVVPDGSHVVTFRVTDNAGNTTTQSTATLNVDTTQPVFSIAVNGTSGTGGWYISTPTASISPTDVTSGVSTTQYQIDGGAWMSGTATLFLTEGLHTVSFTVTDVAGNTRTQTSTINVDVTAPNFSINLSGSVGPGGWYTTAPTASISPTDATSGVGTSQYQIDGGAWVAGTSVVVPDGIHAVTFRVVDNAGIASTQSTSNLQVDTTPPPAFTIVVSGTIGSGSWYVTPPVISVSPTDPTSGVGSVEHNVDGAGWVTGPLLTLPDGSHDVSFRVTDNAGNSTTQSTGTITADATAPSLPIAINGTLGNNGWYTSIVDVVSSPTDATSGILSTTRRANDGTASSGTTYISGTWTSGTTVNLSADGYYSADFQTTDKAGNSTSASTTTIRVIKIDKTIPLVSLTSPLSGIHVQGQIRMSGTMSDVMSGIDRVSIEFVPKSFLLSPSTATATLDTGTGEWIYDWYSEAMKDGEYTVKVTSVDKAGNVSQVSSIYVQVRNKVYWWTGPIFGAATTPTATITLVPTPTVMATVTTLPSPTPGIVTPEARSTIVASSDSGGEVVPEAPARTTPSFLTKNHFGNWQSLTLALGLFGAFALSALVDRRPSALKKTVLIIRQAQSRNREE